MAEKMLKEYIEYVFQNNESCLDSFIDHMFEYSKQTIKNIKDPI